MVKVKYKIGNVIGEAILNDPPKTKEETKRYRITDKQFQKLQAGIEKKQSRFLKLISNNNLVYENTTI